MNIDPTEKRSLTIPEQAKINEEARKKLDELRARTSEQGWWIQDTNRELHRGTIAIEPVSQNNTVKIEVVAIKGLEGQLDIPRMTPYKYDPRYDKPLEGNVIAQVSISPHLGERGRAIPEQETSQLLSNGMWLTEQPFLSEPDEIYVRGPHIDVPALVNAYLYRQKEGQRPFYSNQEEMNVAMQGAIKNYERTHQEDIQRYAYYKEQGREED